MQPITVLSLFDGMSCGRLALERAWIPVRSYYASEIDKYTMQISKKNYPSIIHIGDVSKCEYRYMSGSKKHQWYYLLGEPSSDPLYTNMRRTDIDLLIGGSPCQWFSNAGKGLNFEDPRSKLFFEFVRILNEAKPRYFLLENVKMKKEWQNTISEHLFDIQPVEIDSALLSAQRRKRLYRVWKRNEDWGYSQVEISQPEDKGILLRDIIDWELSSIYQRPRGKNPWWIKKDKSPTLSSNSWQENNFLVGNQYNQKVFTDKSWCLWTGMGRTNKQGMWVYKDSITPENFIRKLTPIECERLQTLPDNYTEWVSNTQRYKMLGNGWTVDVITHIFSEIFKD